MVFPFSEGIIMGWVAENDLGELGPLDVRSELSHSREKVGA